MPEMGYWGDIAAILAGVVVFVVFLVCLVVAIWKDACGV